MKNGQFLLKRNCPRLPQNLSAQEYLAEFCRPKGDKIKSKLVSFKDMRLENNMA